MGIIDTISTGFAVIGRRPWLFLLPLALDLLLLWGPRVSMAPLVEPLAMATPTDNTANEEANLQPVLNALANANLLGILNWQLPSLTKTLALSSDAPLVDVTSFPALAGLVAGFWGLSLGVASLYLTALAMSAQGQALSLTPFLSASLLGARRLLLFFLILFGAGLLLGVPAAFVVAGLSQFSPPLASLLALSALVMVLLSMVYLFFTDEAIFLGNLDARRAIADSFQLVRTHFWPALAFFLLTQLIMVGTPLIWRIILPYRWGGIVAIAGHVYIGTGMAAAAMVFYRHHSPFLQEMAKKGDALPLGQMNS
ncbi:MAG: hypothetical protein HYU86_01540 [Chloroflexi bacterium]|nr:hypothetical protein [Chloroflexota bacterium]